MYDIKQIKAIPVADVARKYGIKLEEKHNRLWGKLRDENTASFSINLSKNLWYDFGARKGGSVIDLVAELEGITSKEAINKLAEDYNIKNEIKQGWQPLTDSQYREIGIQPERATMNFKFDLNVHTPEQLHRWSEKYGMHVRELAEKSPREYNKLVMKVAKEHIGLIRDTYFTKLQLSCDTSINQANRDNHRAWAESDAKEINRKVELLRRAVRGNINLDNLKVDPKKDSKIFNDSEYKSKGFSEDEIVRNKVVQVYKRLFNLPQADFLTVDQAKAIENLNRSVLEERNQYLSLLELKELYKMLGSKIQELNAEYEKYGKSIEILAKDKFDSESLSNLAKDAEGIYRNLEQVKKLFSQCSTALEGFRAANFAYKNDISKQKPQLDQNKAKSNNKDLTR